MGRVKAYFGLNILALVWGRSVKGPNRSRFPHQWWLSFVHEGRTVGFV